MNTLTLNQANQIISAALEKARAMQVQPMSVVVLDDAGDVKAAQREDGASMFRMDIAKGKAWAAVGMSANSRVLAERAQKMPIFFGALAATGQGNFIPQTGALLIKDSNGVILGAVGASGGTGDEDEAICQHGIEIAKLFPA